MEELKELGLEIPAINEIELDDRLILHHGFELYKRDYYFIIETATKEHIGRFKIVFTHCFDLQYRHKYIDRESAEFLRKSWGDELISSNYPNIEGAYWWGQGLTMSYPGFSYNPECVKAKEISEIAGHKMYSIKLETDHYDIDLIFHDFHYVFLNPDTPYSEQLIVTY